MLDIVGCGTLSRAMGYLPHRTVTFFGYVNDVRGTIRTFLNCAHFGQLRCQVKRGRGTHQEVRDSLDPIEPLMNAAILGLSQLGKPRCGICSRQL